MSDSYYKKSGKCISLVDNGDGTYSQHAMDTASKCIVAVSPDIWNVHRGKFFQIPDIIENIGSGATYSISFLTNGFNVHYRHESIATSADNLTVKFYEESSVTAGTTMSAINNNRQSSSTSTVIIKKDVSIQTYGTLIGTIFIGGGTGHKSAGGGQFEGVNKFVLKQNTQYSVLVENGSSGTNTISITPVFVES